MSDRVIFEGTLCVYRSGYIMQHLAADVKLDSGETFYYYPAPKCFDDLITDGTKNVARVRFTADRDTGKNPRSATLVSEPAAPRRRVDPLG